MFEAEVKQNYEAYVAFVISLGAAPQDARDYVQAGLLDALTRLNRCTKSIEGWNIQCIKWRMYKMLKARRAKTRTVPADWRITDFFPEALNITEEQVKEVQRAFRTLDERKQNILWLYYYLGWDMTAIAKHLKYSRQYINTLHNKAIRELKQIIFPLHESIHRP